MQPTVKFRYHKPFSVEMGLLTLLIAGFLDPCSTGGGGGHLVAIIVDMRAKLGTVVYSNKIYTIGYFFISNYIYDVTMTS